MMNSIADRSADQQSPGAPKQTWLMLSDTYGSGIDGPIFFIRCFIYKNLSTFFLFKGGVNSFLVVGQRFYGWVQTLKRKKRRCKKGRVWRYHFQKISRKPAPENILPSNEMIVTSVLILILEIFPNPKRYICADCKNRGLKVKGMLDFRWGDIWVNKTLKMRPPVNHGGEGNQREIQEFFLWYDDKKRGNVIIY